MIKLNIDNRIASIILDRAPVNAINDEWIGGINNALEEIENHRQISVVHINTAQKAFCAGADLAMMKRLLATPDGRDDMIKFIRRMQQVFFRLEKISAVTIAELGRSALGGGLELALACDFRIAGDNVKLGLPEAGLGLLPGAGGTQRLTRICGEAVSRRLILGAEIITGKEAARLGVAQWSIPDEQLSQWTNELVQRLGKLPVNALASCKSCIAAAVDDNIDGYELELTETRKLHDIPESQEYIQAFLEKSL